jgi:hypothetical protein
MRTLLTLSALILAAPGCSTVSEGAGDCVCTMEFRTVQVRVVDAAGQPVGDLDVTVTNQRSGETLDVQQEAAGPPAAGTYTVVTDGNVDDVSVEGDDLLFRATGHGRTAEATFVVGRDACACHIDRREGPEQIVAR